MADELDILIRTTADRTGAEDTKQSIEEIKTSSKETGAVGVKVESEVQAATEKTTVSKGELKKMLRLVGHEAGDMGRILRYALNPMILVTAAIALGIHKITSAFADWKKKIEDAALELQKLNQAKLDGVQTAVAAGTVEMAKFQHEIDNAGVNVDKLKEKFERMRAAFKAANLEEAEADRKELAERTRVQEEKNWRAETAKKQALALDQDTGFLGAQATMATEKAKTEGLQTSARQTAKKAGATPEWIAESVERLGTAFFTVVAAGDAKLTQAGEAYAKLADNQKKIAEAQAIITAQSVAKIGADITARSLGADAMANTARIEEMQRQRGIGRSGVRGGTAARFLTEAEGISGRAAAGGKVSTGEQSLVRQVATVATGKNVDFATAVKALEFEKSHLDTNTKFLERLITVIENNVGGDSSFEQRISNLESKMNNMPRR